MENECEKVDRLMELYERYTARMAAEERRLGTSEEEYSDKEVLLARIGAGLYTLQRVRPGLVQPCSMGGCMSPAALVLTGRLHGEGMWSECRAKAGGSKMVVRRVDPSRCIEFPYTLTQSLTYQCSLTFSHSLRKGGFQGHTRHCGLLAEIPRLLGAITTAPCRTAL